MKKIGGLIILALGYTNYYILFVVCFEMVKGLLRGIVLGSLVGAYMGVVGGNFLGHYLNYREALDVASNPRNSSELRKLAEQYGKEQSGLLRDVANFNPLHSLNSVPKPYELVYRSRED